MEQNQLDQKRSSLTSGDTIRVNNVTGTCTFMNLCSDYNYCIVKFDNNDCDRVHLSDVILLP